MALGEFALIDRYFSRIGARRGDVILGVGDDGAILAPPAGMDLVAVADILVEGRHFPKDSPARSIGHRVLAVNLSDIAAMGATPAWALLSISMPAVDECWLAEFAAGFSTLAEAHGVALVGGDTTAGPLTLSVQVMGFVPQGASLRRAGGKPGDWVCVSGTLGDAAAALALGDRAPAALRARFEFPTPRVALGKSLQGLATACMDVSDGLLGDLGKLAQASGCRAEIELSALPRSAALRDVVTSGACTPAQVEQFMLAGGDDYELLFTLPGSAYKVPLGAPSGAPPGAPQAEALRADALRAAFESGEITRIGRLIEGDSSSIDLIVGDQRKSVQPEGYDHFRSISA